MSEEGNPVDQHVEEVPGKKYVFPAVKNFRELTPLLSEVISNLQNENKKLKARIAALEKSSNFAHLNLKSLRAETLGTELVNNKPTLTTENKSLSKRIENLETQVDLGLNLENGWIKSENEDILRSMDSKINNLREELARPAAPEAKTSYADMTKKTTNLQRDLIILEQTMSKIQNQQDEGYGSAVILLEQKPEENLVELIEPLIPELRDFKARRIGKTKRVQIKPLNDSKDFFLENNYKQFNNFKKDHPELKVQIWMNKTELTAWKSLNKFGFSAKTKENSKVKFYQIRGNRIRLIGENNSYVGKFFFNRSTGEVEASGQADPDFDKAFPTLK